jgi:D-sedoheptulose 7-phosphate isomerase
MTLQASSQPDTSMAIVTSAFTRHLVTLFKLQEAEYKEKILQSAQLLLEAASNNKTLLICGNGGSASDASHLAGEWVARYKKHRRALNAIALSGDSATLTAIGNDYGFENIYARQVEALSKAGDVLIAITTSGQSQNILKAIETARTLGMKIILLTGAGGAQLESQVDCCIAIPDYETARIQEMHEIIYHIWGEYIDTYVS